MISRQGLEQIALVLAVGSVLFAGLAVLRRRRRQELRRVAISAGIQAGLAAVSLVLAYTIAPNIPTPPVPLTARFLQDPTPDTPATVARGKALFQANCALCHGPVGKGDGALAPTLFPHPVNLQLHVPQHAPGELYYWVSNGIPGTSMPAWSEVDPATAKPRLSDDERWMIIRYLQALAQGETP
ncbi:MAG TPA: cytochrome c [Candidatus Limnocylindria bacterium]|nr:cytochrome c [Candidatus Limnocylindria bacterium]